MKVRVLLFFLVFSFSFSSYTQERKNLEKERIKLQAKIKEINSVLFATQKKEKNALEELRDLNYKIDARKKLIAAIAQESKALKKEIATHKKEKNRLTKELVILKKDYGDMIFKSYKSKSQQNKMMFILSSKNFFQAYKRLEYMKQYTSFRKKQGELIVDQGILLDKITDSLGIKKSEKEDLIKEEEKHKTEVEEDKKTQESVVSIIKKDEKKYKKELQNKLNEEKKLTSKIDKLIREAIARSKKKKGAKKTSGFALTPEAKVLSTSFANNRGKLPWPVNNGVIVRRFGKQSHPTIKGIIITGTGIDIAANKGTEAQSVFNGTVIQIFTQSEGKKMVLIQHGNYITAYHNLEKSYVRNGDKITTGQKIGRVFTNKTTGKTEIRFVVFKETKRQNPAKWLRKR